MAKGKIVTLEDRIPKLKEQRKRKANRRLIVLLLMFFVLIACVVYVQSPLSHVRAIKIDGNQAYSDMELVKITGLTINTNVWKVDRSEISRKLKRLPEIKKANVKIALPNSVVISVVEHKRIAYLYQETKYYPVLANGKTLFQSKNAEIVADVPILIGFKEGKMMDEISRGLTDLPQEVYNSISEVHYLPEKRDEYHISIFMNDGFEVSATLRSFTEKMAHYPSIISQLDPGKKGVIDLEVGSFFKAYDSEGEKTVEETEDER